MYSGIYNTFDCAKYLNGQGVLDYMYNIRAAGSHIHDTNGTNNGLVSMLRVFNNTARYVDQAVKDTVLLLFIWNHGMVI